MACVVAAAAMRHWAQVSVELPLGVRSTPLWICLPSLTALFSLPVASTPHTQLERQSARFTRRFRLAAGLTSTAVALSGAVVMLDRPIATPVAAWTFALCGCGLVAVRLVGPHAWAPQALLAIGLTSVAAGGTGPDLVSASAGPAALAITAGWWLVALVACAAGEPASALRHPRRPPRPSTPKEP
ncbi:hypothetical protein IFT73_06945 [Aeromicrobium sp. CFBP 8757]|uniref:hypothetical protein n=1 Tax=Aeromicrobium sp. CFBP 8757 TaxID=2775288 RepID=UPI001785240C|nr:hypothetical protein [Aeromicrobium sp. CFBP 8757]MBD8606588.1 hypothetical protein [Aeromicrobium sp. CFBP 8757]